MIKLLKVSAVVMIAGLASACATTNEVEELRTELKNELSTVSSQVTQANAAAAQASESANNAAASAVAATAEASRAATAAEATNAKLDRLLNKTMMK